MKVVKKRALTLIEIMIVIALNGIIGSVLGVNMKKSMDKAKAFKATAHKQKIEDALNMHYAQSNESPNEILIHLEDRLIDSGLFKDPNRLLVDPFGNRIEVIFDNGSFVCN
jgi:prepilin-type N-terminal cleavage/methylation domain-containing protein